MTKSELTWFIYDRNNPTSAFNYCDSVNDCPALLERARNHNREDVARCEMLAECHPKDEYWKAQLKKAKSANYICGEWADFQRAQKEHLIGDIHEITEAEWYEALEVLPPLRWADYAHGYNMFFCREAYTGTFRSQYAKKGGKYYSAMVDTSDESTWINNRMHNPTR